jgi:Fe-S cluster biogenesis protein NfuA
LLPLVRHLRDHAGDRDPDLPGRIDDLSEEVRVTVTDEPKTDSAAAANIETAKVEQVIEVIRPAVQADGGDIFLRDVNTETGVVTVELVGACVSCPASTVTLKAGIERILKDRVPGVTGVVDVNEGVETSISL